ncbi:MAG: 50S ribosomal protein L1 [Pelagibacteraceae bacterium TMED237]|nr:MAG: 50S ribosomal protein L1 [Pelagibacteraceae bacterium TMED237]
MNISKKRKNMIENLDIKKTYEPIEAIKILKEKSYVKFNETIDVSINLGIDSNKTDQNIKGITNLPKGTGKKIILAVITGENKQSEARENGADLVGEKEIVENISSNKIEFDVLIASPDMMPALGKVAKILGPRGLMPNPKLGTVTNDIAKAVKDAKSGQVKFKNDKAGIVHAGIGKLDFKEEDILENLKTLYSSIVKSKPDAVKGSFIKKVTIASTMGIGLQINQASLR